jgi:hypothetical protein
MDKSLTINGKNPTHLVTLGFKDELDNYIGFHDNQPGHLDSGSGLFYKSTSTGEPGFQSGWTWNSLEALVDLNDDGLFDTETEKAERVNYFSMKEPYLDQTIKIFPKDVITPEPTTMTLFVSGLLALCGIKKKK